MQSDWQINSWNLNWIDFMHKSSANYPKPTKMQEEKSIESNWLKIERCWFNRFVDSFFEKIPKIERKKCNIRHRVVCGFHLWAINHGHILHHRVCVCVFDARTILLLYNVLYTLNSSTLAWKWYWFSVLRRIRYTHAHLEATAKSKKKYLILYVRM